MENYIEKLTPAIMKNKITKTRPLGGILINIAKQEIKKRFPKVKIKLQEVENNKKIIIIEK